MRLRLVLPTLPAAGLAALAAPVSYDFTTDYGAYDSGPLAYFAGGFLISWPAVVMAGALAGVVPYRLGERRAALMAGVAMTLVAVLAIGVGSVLGTRARAAQLPTSPVCVASAAATAEDAKSIEELENALAEIDHPARFDALSAEASTDHCQNAFSGGEGTYHWVAPYETLLEGHGWQVTTDTSSYNLLTATRGRFRITIYVDDPGFRGLTTLRIEHR